MYADKQERTLAILAIAEDLVHQHGQTKLKTDIAELLRLHDGSPTLLRERLNTVSHHDLLELRGNPTANGALLEWLIANFSTVLPFVEALIALFSKPSPAPTTAPSTAAMVAGMILTVILCQAWQCCTASETPTAQQPACCVTDAAGNTTCTWPPRPAQPAACPPAACLPPATYTPATATSNRWHPGDLMRQWQANARARRAQRHAN